MNPLLILKAEWRRSWQGILGLALVLGLAVSLGLALSMLERGVRQGAAQAGDDFDVLLGAQGSPTQLLLSAVYLQAQALPLLPYATLHQVQAHSGTAWAAPLAFGDRWKTFPLVGTVPLLSTMNGKRPLAEGKNFASLSETHGETHAEAHGEVHGEAHTEAHGEVHDEVHTETHGEARLEAVVGASVPLAVGERFTPMHGRVALPDGNHSHDKASFTVVGRMPPTGSPWDRAILVPLESVWAAHDLHEGEVGADISAVVVKARSVADAYKLRAQWQTASTQAVFTGEVLTNLFATLGDVRAMMQAMATVSQAIALGGVILATLFAVALRRDSLSLLRTLGAPRPYLLLSVWGMAGGVIMAGVGIGMGLALVEAHIAALLIEHSTATRLPVHFTGHEWGMAALFALAGLLTAGIPALTAYRKTA